MKTNLITKNVILRFKLGLKILKFLKAGKFAYHGTPVQYVLNSKEKNVPLYYYKDNKGLSHYVKESDLDKVDKFGNYIGSDEKIYSGSGNNHTITYINSGNKKVLPNYNMSTVTLKDGKYLDANGNVIGTNKGIYLNAFNYLVKKHGKEIANRAFKAMKAGLNYSGGKWQSLSSVNQETPKGGGIRKDGGSKVDSNRYISTLGDIEAYKNSLTTEGLADRDTVKAFLLKLIDAGFDLGKSGADGIWGKNTEAAYQAMLAKNKEPIPTLTYLPVLLYVPSLGYRTDFDYTGPNSNIRDLGFNDYATMVNFINNNPDHLFSKDMIKRFGNTNDWNLNNVESALHISGKYRPGRGGDFSDLMKSQADWAGTENGNYDRRQNFWNNLKVINGRLLFKQGGLISKNPVKRFKTKVK